MKTEFEKVLGVTEAQMLGLDKIIKCLLDMQISMVSKTSDLCLIKILREELDWT